ncbi:MAG TPA: F0F1 ATP synthase subunit B [Janthinobacterium sp.]|nr:F0F1 ATP synthase subunit B [Janthinobacterium sp.]
MLIDWFTVGAQALNFLILVWLMKRFLYRPILRAIDAREKLIAGQLADAAAKQAAAQQERDAFLARNADFDARKAALLAQAGVAADAERLRLIEAARKAADDLGAKRRAAMENDAARLNETLARRARQEVFAIARKTLSELAGADLEQRACEVFLRRLRELDEGARAALAAALGGAPARVRSAFELTPARRTALLDTLKTMFGDGIALDFETAPELVSGIELTAGGQKLAWSIADYLLALERGVAELLDQRAAATVPAAGGAAPTPVPA